jgi:aminopeptidase N
VTVDSYRDYWLMEALANYSALMYLEKSKGTRESDRLLDVYRNQLLTAGDTGTVDATGPIVLGSRLENSQEPRAWRTITYGKGSWIIHMLRQRLGDARFSSLLAEVIKRYDRRSITTEIFRELAAGFLQPKSEDPKLEVFFDQWVYGTGIPALKLDYSIKGKAPNLRLSGTITQSDVDDDFSALVPVEIQVARGKTITRWVASSSTPVNFTVPLTQAPLKVALDPKRGLLRR